jgi:hypothetical protein
MIQIKLVGMPMISYYTKVHLFKWNGSWVVSTKQTMDFNIQTAAMFVFLFSTKMVLLKVVYPLNIYQYTQFHGPTLTGESLHPPQKFERPPFWNSWRYGIKKYGVEVTFNGIASPLNLIKMYPLVQKLLGWGHRDRQTDRQTGDLIRLTFLFKESRLKKQPSTCKWYFFKMIYF